MGGVVSLLLLKTDAQGNGLMGSRLEMTDSASTALKFYVPKAFAASVPKPSDPIVSCFLVRYCNYRKNDICLILRFKSRVKKWPLPQSSSEDIPLCLIYFHSERLCWQSWEAERLIMSFPLCKCPHSRQSGSSGTRDMSSTSSKVAFSWMHSLKTLLLLFFQNFLFSLNK